MSWRELIKESFETNAKETLKQLPTDHEASFSLEGEQSEFVRFSKSKVRQTTSVEQASVTLTLQGNKKLTRVNFPLTGQKDEDRKRFLLYFGKAKNEMSAMPENPYPVKMAENGKSSTDRKAHFPIVETLIQEVTAKTAQDDFVGYLASGPMLRGVINSHNTHHWYASDIYFVDYSLFEGKNAVTANVAGTNWDEDQWNKSLSQSRAFLHQMRKPRKKLERGAYRTFLAPGAVQELISTACWGGFSQSAFKQSHSGLRLLYAGEKKLSEKFTLFDNYDLGLAEPFSAIGENISPKLCLIEKGVGKNLITSSKTAAEFGGISTGGDDYEMPKSLELLPGNLKQEDVFKKLGTGLYLSNLHYVNWSDPKTARMTGMTRFACFWVENGDIVGPLEDMRFDVSLYEIFGDQLVDLTQGQDTLVNNLTYGSRGLGGKRLPGALIDGFKLTL
ncbi:MAG: metallopeptidase TldD-related protein [Bdellovibrionales bacterium]